MTDETFAPIDDVMKALKSIPGIDDDKAERIAARDQMEREYRIGLATIRQVASMTQAEVAEKLGVQQSAVSKIENRGDILLSTMKHYFDAVGAQATIAIRVGGVEHHATLEELIGA